MARRSAREVVRAYSSRARVDTTCVLLWVSVSALEARLRPLGLELAAPDGAPRGQHPVWLDLGYVKSGVGEALALNQHEWWRRTAETTGSAWGVASSAWTLGALPAHNQLFTSSALRIAEQFSLGISRTWGTYEEVLVGVPNVFSSSSGRGPYCFVLGMYTNSPVAIWGDRSLRYGYGKRLCRIAGEPFRSFAVRDTSGTSLLSAAIDEAAATPWRPAGAIAGLAAQVELLSQPLLGHLGGDGFAVSRLERDYFDDQQTLARPSRVLLTIAPALLAESASDAHAIAAVADECPWGAFSLAHLPTRVTYPNHLPLSEL